jgi:hypothetical protein
MKAYRGNRNVAPHIFNLSTICTDTDCGVCSWPWQWFSQGKADRPLFVTSNRCIPVQNSLGWSAVVFCACEILQLFSVVFFLVRAVRNFDFLRVINETINYVMPWQRFMFLTWCVFPPWPSSRVLSYSTHPVQVNCILLCKGVSRWVVTLIPRPLYFRERTQVLPIE